MLQSTWHEARIWHIALLHIVISWVHPCLSYQTVNASQEQEPGLMDHCFSHSACCRALHTKVMSYIFLNLKAKILSYLCVLLKLFH